MSKAADPKLPLHPLNLPTNANCLLLGNCTSAGPLAGNRCVLGLSRLSPRTVGTTRGRKEHKDRLPLAYNEIPNPTGQQLKP